MTAVQAVVAMGTFALAVLAPQLGVDLQALGWLGSILFGIGALSSLAAGWLIRKVGDLVLAALCMGAVMVAMLSLTFATSGWPLWLAVLFLGLAFGPETPASVSVLARVTPLARRPWIFSVRQTGNQLGAMLGSLILPVLLLQDPSYPFVLVAALSLAVALWCAWLLRINRFADIEPSVPIARANLSGLHAILTLPLLRLLTLTTVVFMVVQVCLNLFVMSHAVQHWQLSVSSAASLVAVMQGAGLVGRLLWGHLAQRPGLSTLRLLGALGLIMGSAGLVLFLWSGTPPTLLLAVLLALVGLSASGWNGIMMAEIARIVGPSSAGAASGAVLLFGYSGLSVAPAGFAALAASYGTVVVFATLLALAGLMGGCIAHYSKVGSARTLT